MDSRLRGNDDGEGEDDGMQAAMGVGRGAWGVGRGAWGVGRGAWGVGRGAWGVGRGAWIPACAGMTTGEGRALRGNGGDGVLM